MKEKETIIWTCGLFNIVNDEIWFVPYEHNILCRYSIRKNVIIENVILNVNLFQIESFDISYRSGNKVFLIPGFEQSIHVFDIEKNKMNCTGISEYKGVGEKFLLCHQYNDWIYLFPSFYDKIIRINTNTMVVEEIEPNKDKMCNHFNDIDVNGSKAYLVNKTNEIYIFDFEKNKLGVEYRFTDEIELRTISLWNDKLVVANQEGKVFMCDLDKHNITPFAEYNMEFLSSYCIKSSLFLIPLLEKDYFIKVNLENKNMQKIQLCKKDKYKKWPHATFSRGAVFKEYLCLFSTQYRTLIIYNCITGEIIENFLNLELPNIDRNNLNSSFRDEIEKKKCIIEGNGQYSTLCRFIDFCIDNK